MGALLRGGYRAVLVNEDVTQGLLAGIKASVYGETPLLLTASELYLQAQDE